MSLASERIQAILTELDAEAEGRGKSAAEIADILLQRKAEDNAESTAEVQEVQEVQEEFHIAAAPIYDTEELESNLYAVNTRWRVEYYRDIVNYGRGLERIVIFAKRVVRKLIRSVVEPIVRDVQEFHAVVTRTLNALRNNDIVFDNHIREIEAGNARRDLYIQSLKRGLQAAEQKAGSLSVQLEEQRMETEALRNKLGKFEAEMAAKNRSAEVAALHEKLGNLEAEMAAKDRSAEVAALHEKLGNLEAEMAAKDRSAEVAALHEKLEKFEAEMAARDQAYLDINYFEFENRFRGSRTAIKEQQKTYLHHYAGCKNVVDLGCGRGEFLELLGENRIPVTGVDLYEPFVDYCRTRGLRAVCADAVQYLLRQGDASCDGIFASQLAEHMSTQDLITLCRESYRVLEEGKTLVIETPNPTCVSTYLNSFYLDPTHTKPVHPKTLEYFLQEAGFRKVDVVYTQQSRVGYRLPLLSAPAENLAEFNDGVNFMTDIIFGSQDYAIIAVK